MVLVALIVVFDIFDGVQASRDLLKGMEKPYAPYGLIYFNGSTGC